MDRRPRQKAERGQSYTEYVIVLMMVAMALLARDPSGQPYVGKLLSAVKTYYQGYTMAVSLPALPSDK